MLEDPFEQNFLFKIALNFENGSQIRFTCYLKLSIKSFFHFYGEESLKLWNSFMAERFQKGSSSFYEKDYPKIPIPNEPPSLDGLFSAANSRTLNEIFLIDHYFIKTYSQRERNLLRSNILSREIKLSKSPVKKRNFDNRLDKRGILPET